MSNKPITQFGKREAALAVQQDRPTKRSGHVALLLAGTVAIGGGAYALMPAENCEPARPGMATFPAAVGCSPRGSSSSAGHGSSRSSFYSGDSSSSRSPTGASSSDSSSGGVTRGGFGAFAHAFTSHFSGGG
ncbi:MAG TPA: hypothetical protein VGO49_02220 [Bradyrhizobium sp.]|jgi:hypothetical protein|nr:hypothetical protein [Bradyrhizobium sp.]